jgi:hypothetical protein
MRGGYFSLLFFDRGWSVKWILKLVTAGREGPWVDVMEISKPDGLGDIANLGLDPAEAKQLLGHVRFQGCRTRQRSPDLPMWGIL